LSKEDTLDEYLLIQKYFSNIGSAFLAEHNVEIAVGDDAAVITPKDNVQYIHSVDTSIENIHFLSSMAPEDIAYRSCSVALSDLAACGANPEWYSLAITLPSPDGIWLERFSSGLREFSDEFKIPLVGGDTTKGSLSITVQVMGSVKKGEAILRSGAKPDQGIFVSGLIGEAYLSLKVLQNLKEENSNCSAYLRPKAQISLGRALVGIATSAIDISDGLLQDIELVCKSSHVGAKIYLDRVPTSTNDKSVKVINSGDDYQICFTAPMNKSMEINQMSEKLEIPITQIGQTTKSEKLILLDELEKEMEIGSGFKHF